MIGDLPLERGLDQSPRQLGERTALAGQLQPTLPGAADQASDQLLIDRVQTIGTRRPVAYKFVQVNGLLLGITSIIGCCLRDRSYTVVFYSPAAFASGRSLLRASAAAKGPQSTVIERGLTVVRSPAWSGAAVAGVAGS